ncbi:Gametoproteintin-binding protein 2 [Desmophyllum pertusum]|uniref:Gametoproteintin-binding protein 2 n=1 Tax=Desmophyllum pertusum TaxID=174260 RepID=A0A9W9Z5P6_9CNID|nr:Gametoproteintin-binding protein 2 [Desmophyllum pertusum]
MAKLVAVCRDEADFAFERRQIPLNIEDTLTRFQCLSVDDRAVAYDGSGKKDVLSFLSHSVPCVGCRRSVERLYNQLVESGQPALEPLIITNSGEGALCTPWKRTSQGHLDFGTECKSKVLRAYSILAGDLDGPSEKGYCAALYDGLKRLSPQRAAHPRTLRYRLHCAFNWTGGAELAGGAYIAINHRINILATTEIAKFTVSQV